MAVSVIVGLMAGCSAEVASENAKSPATASEINTGVAAESQPSEPKEAKQGNQTPGKGSCAKVNANRPLVAPCEKAQNAPLTTVSEVDCTNRLEGVEPVDGEAPMEVIKDLWVGIEHDGKMELFNQLSGGVSSCDKVPNGSGGDWSFEAVDGAVQLKLCPCTCERIRATGNVQPRVIRKCGAGPVWMG